MRSVTTWLAAMIVALTTPACIFSDEVLLEDRFERDISDKWEVVGLKKGDYRVRDGGLEVRVQPRAPNGRTPMLKVVLPFTVGDTVSASVNVTVLNQFTSEDEFGGVFLIDETGMEFGAKKQRKNDQLVFSPGDYIFKGQPGEEGDPAKYTVKYTAASEGAGPLRVITQSKYAFFQVGPSAKGEYLNFFHSAVNATPKVRGFCLVAAGAPDAADHWVRFEDFRVTKSN